MSKLNTRVRVALVSLLAGIIYFVEQFIDWQSFFNVSGNTLIANFFNALIIGILIFFGTYWALFGKVKGERIISILLFPAVSLLILSLVIEILITSIFYDSSRVFIQVFSTIIISFYSYVMILTANILNASYLEKIPLAQAGKAALFILTLITAYLSYLVLFTNNINLYLRLAAILIMTLFLTYQCLWSLKLNIQKRTAVTFVISLTMAIFGMVLSFWPMLSPYLALAMSLVLYLLLNIALEERELVGTWMWVEYLVIFALIALLMLIFSEWGINGPLI